MALDLFAGIPVSDYAVARSWYERLLGSAPSFLPNDVEAVWQVAEHAYLYVLERSDGAGRAVHTLFVDDFDARTAAMAGRGLEPARVETYANGVRKATYLDPDGNEVGIGGAPNRSGADGPALGTGRSRTTPTTSDPRLRQP